MTNRSAQVIGRALLVSAAFLALYALGAQRGMSWQDSGEFQFRVLAGDLTWHSGIARAHPGYILAASAFARLLGFVSGGAIDAVFATTLFSSFAMGVALFLLFVVVHRATGRDDAALLAAVTLGLAHMVRWMATMAEVYAPSLAFSMGELLLLDFAVRSPRRRGILLPLLFLASGAHFSFHNFALLNLPVYAVAAACLLKPGNRAIRSLGVSLACLLLFALGSLPILRLAALEAGNGAGLADILRSILFGSDYRNVVLGLAKTPFSRIAASYGLAALSILAPAWLFAARGMGAKAAEGQTPAMRRALGALTIIHAVFWCRYFVPDQATFILPLLGYLAVWAGIGSAALSRTALRRILVVSAAVQLLVPPLALAAARRSDLCQRVLAARREVPFRDEAAYWLLPWKQREKSAEAFAKAALLEMPAGGTLYADSTAAPPLMMLERAGGSEGLGFRLATPWTSEAPPSPDETACFAVSRQAPYLPPAWRSGVRFEKTGAIHRVVTESDK